MKLVFLAAALLGPVFAQTAATPKFEASDIHTAAKSQFPFARPVAPHNGRYEIKNASIVDLVRIAYGFDADHILGGPHWLELDRFHLAAKVPEHTTADDLKPMLQALLEDRFQLKAHKDTKPMPTYALTVVKKPNMKESDGSGETGCRPRAGSGGGGGAPAQGGVRIMTSGPDGRVTTLDLGSDMSIHFECTNMTMKSFAESLRGMMGANLGSNPVLDETGLEGRFNFDVHWSFGIIPIISGNATHITVFDALEKQLGLKLLEKQVPAPVIIVDSVNRRPSENPPGTAEVLPPPVLPSEFDVASIKQVETMDFRQPGRFLNQPGGRLTVERMPLSYLASRAFNSRNREAIAGLPGFADSTYFDVTAKAAMDSAAVLDNDTVAAPLLALLKDRFKMTYHTEERPVSAYTLTATKPKLKKADPEARTKCTGPNTPPGTPPGSRVLTCQNISMEEFVDRLQNLSPDLTWPVTDSTGLEGRWDLTLTYSPSAGRMMPAMAMGGGGGGGAASAGGGDSPVPVASDAPQGYTLFEALEKQLGLKLVSQKRPAPVIVIDHIEQKPTEN